jgi:hypothetical protein
MSRNIHIYFVDAKYFFKKRDLMFTIFCKNDRFGNLGLILGVYKDIMGQWC